VVFVSEWLSESGVVHFEIPKSSTFTSGEPSIQMIFSMSARFDVEDLGDVLALVEPELDPHPGLVPPDAAAGALAAAYVLAVAEAYPHERLGPSVLSAYQVLPPKTSSARPASDPWNKVR